VINALSYHQARNHSLPVGAPYIASAGYLFRMGGVREGALIRSVGDTPTPTLQALQQCFADLPEDQREVTIRYHDINATGNQEHIKSIPVPRHWLPGGTASVCTRCLGEPADSAQSWTCEQIPAAAPVGEAPSSGSTFFPPGTNAVEAALSPSLVTVDFGRPFAIGGQVGQRFRGTGLIVDTKLGLVVVDRQTVPSFLGDANVTFASSIKVPAEVVYVHPHHNFAMVRFDPVMIGETPIRAAELLSRAPETGEEATLVGLTSSVNFRRAAMLVSRKTRVAQVGWVQQPVPSPPAFRDTNIDLIDVEDRMTTEGGVVADSSGGVLALWAAFPFQQGGANRQFYRGMPMDHITEAVETFRAVDGEMSRMPSIRSLGAEFEPISIAAARALGMQDATAREFEAHNSSRRTVLSVVRRQGGTGAAQELKDGDILNTVNGKRVSSFREVETAVAGCDEVEAEVLRYGTMHKVTVQTTVDSGTEPERVVEWAGSLLTDVPKELCAQHGVDSVGVYVAAHLPGSPVTRTGLNPTCRIVEVDGEPVDGLESFLGALKGKAETVRIKGIAIDGKTKMSTVPIDNSFWETYEVRFVNNKWTASPLSH